MNPQRMTYNYSPFTDIKKWRAEKKLRALQKILLPCPIHPSPFTLHQILRLPPPAWRRFVAVTVLNVKGKKKEF
jgi:hypothetical protein